MHKKIRKILKKYCSDRTRLIDILWDVQHLYGYIPDESVTQLASGLNMSAQDIRETSSFYHFFHDRPSGKYRIYLGNTVIAKMNGYQAVHDALERESGAKFGVTDDSGTFGLFETACIGLSDQEPAMLIDNVVFTRLTAKKVTAILSALRQGISPAKIANPNAIASDDRGYVDALVETNIHQQGPVFFQGKTDFDRLLKRCLKARPEKVIAAISQSELSGRGGAGFPTGIKWRFCREAPGDTKYVICNADEGEPGTFKDRVLLTRSPKDVFMGMVIAAYAIGAREGIIYLRAEYIYLKDYLEKQLQELLDAGLLGRNILGRKGFDFNIRIQIGAGSYVCGDESALIESCEGKRGTPRVKPPFPVQQGYLGKPTCVNNVETLTAVTRIMDEGADWFKSMGTSSSTGTHLLSVSGDCDHPGVYEIEWGISLNEVLAMVGARDPWAAQISGPSGECVAVEQDGERLLECGDLSCSGSLMIFNRSRNLLGIVKDFMQFFVNESCGICTPCRAGNIELHKKVERVIAGRACQQDLDEAVSWGNLVRNTSRCGLGETSSNPILTTLDKFPEIYRAKLVQQTGPLLSSFDLDAALLGNELAREELTQGKGKLK
ncbi:MAG: NAD(P)H-dependent oxidoreductase subunit E [Amphritea sp.]